MPLPATGPADLVAQGLDHHRAGRLDRAEALYRHALDLDPTQSDALYLLGTARFQAGDHAEAIRAIGRAITFRRAPHYLYQLALAQAAAGRQADAARAVTEALAARPDWPEALNVLGQLHLEAGRVEPAIARFREALDLRPAFGDARLRLADALQAAGRHEEAVGEYYGAIAMGAGTAPAWNNLGVALQRRGRDADALAAFRQAVSLDPRHAPSRHNMAAALLQRGLFDDAEPAHRAAIALDPAQPEAHNNLGTILQRQGRTREAADAYRAALARRPDFPAALAQLVFQRRQGCDWEGIAAEEARVVDAVRAGAAGVPPFVTLGLPCRPQDHLACARRHASDLEPLGEGPRPRAVARADGRIRLGYLTNKLGEDPLGHLLAEVFERLDRRRFDVVAYTHGHPDGSDLHRRLLRAFDRVIDVATMPDAEAARRIRGDGIDILIDLDGYTADARSGIAARRPAPVQVHAVGFPGTLGADFFDYILLDAHVAPRAAAADFHEQVVHLPHCYLPRDTRDPVGPAPSRTACGLPEGGFVFCCFNNAYKITAQMLDIWARLLLSVPGSVLWLIEANGWSRANLLREAAARGVPGDRLVFAPRMPHPAYLAHLGAADLFLDTLPYNAHTTAGDALWAGLPVVTCTGGALAGRVAGSVLKAAGLPDLVTGTLDEYAALALRLAREPATLAPIRARVAAARSGAPLFDTARYTRTLETAFARMYTLSVAGEPPRAFTVPDEAGGDAR